MINAYFLTSIVSRYEYNQFSESFYNSDDLLACLHGSVNNKMHPVWKQCEINGYIFVAYYKGKIKYHMSKKLLLDEIFGENEKDKASLPPHLFRELVNDLRDISRSYNDYGCLREKIKQRLLKDIEPRV